MTCNKNPRKVDKGEGDLGERQLLQSVSCSHDLITTQWLIYILFMSENTKHWRKLNLVCHKWWWYGSGPLLCHRHVTSQAFFDHIRLEEIFVFPYMVTCTSEWFVSLSNRGISKQNSYWLVWLDWSDMYQSREWSAILFNFTY